MGYNKFPDKNSLYEGKTISPEEADEDTTPATPPWNKTQAKMPEWEDLTPEQKAVYGSPMKYARKRMTYLQNAVDEDNSGS